jgi:uncharacterized membrane protein
MFELIALISIFIAITALTTAKGVRSRLETEIAALKLELKRIEALRGAPAAAPGEAASPEVSQAEAPAEAAAEAISEEMPSIAEAEEQQAEDVAFQEAAAETAEAETIVETPADTPQKPFVAARESFESKLAARWSVWVGGLALAFAGIFAVKYSIDQGLLSPPVRMSLAALFGLVLMASGEWVRRRTTALVENTFQNAMIPGILTAAGSLTLMGDAYVAHLLDYLGPASAFMLLALISLLTLALSLIHGQALAGLGLLASFVTPLLVTSDNPSPWSLFGFLTIAWIGSTLASKLRGWRVAPAIANAGLSIWALIYLVAVEPFQVAPVTLPLLIMIAGLAFIWPGRWVVSAADEAADSPHPIVKKPPSAWDRLIIPHHLASTLVAALGVMLAAIAIAAPDHANTGHAEWGFAALVIALALFGALRLYAIYPAVFSALAALAGIRMMSFGSGSVGFNASVEGTFQPAIDPFTVTWLALGLGAFFAALGIVLAFRRREESLPHLNVWIVLATLIPLALGGFSFIFFGNYNFDLLHGLYAVLLGAAYLAAAQMAFRGPEFEDSYNFARDGLVAASWAAFIFALLVMTNDLATTLGAAFLGFAYLAALRIRNWPILPWGMAASAIFVAGRIAWEPTIVGADDLSKTPVFNELLIGYGIPSALLIASAWLLRKHEDGRIRSVIEALAALFTLLTMAILVRHAMNGGVLNDAVPTLGEQAIYTLLTVGASATLMALDLRHPSIVFRTGSMAAGYVSMISVISAHYVGLNPYYTGESTGRIIFFNLLFLAYLLPGLAYGGAAWFARGRRPQHYVIALALTGASLLFAYVSLSVRRVFHGADISAWKGFLQPELYTYSVVWLLLGVVLLFVGYRFRAKSIRIASAVLVLIAVLKVFLVDMSNLEGLFRVLSFIGLGVALIGIGRFYQTILTGLADDDQPKEETPEAAKPESAG